MAPNISGVGNKEKLRRVSSVGRQFQKTDEVKRLPFLVFEGESMSSTLVPSKLEVNLEFSPH